MGGRVRIFGENDRQYQGHPIPSEHARDVAEAIDHFVLCVRRFVPNAFPLGVPDDRDPSYALGSTWLMFAMDPEWLATYKPAFGDIDLAVNERCKKELDEFLQVGRRVGDFNIRAKKSTSSQTTLICEFPIVNPMLRDHFIGNLRAQVDLSYVPYHNGQPIELTKYMHRVSAEDTELGLKGAHSKNFLSSLTAARPKTALVRKAKYCYDEEVIEPYSLSVRGLRERYEQVGVGVYRLVNSKDATYSIDPFAIFSLLFRADVSEDDLEKLQSVRGIVELINRYYSDVERTRVFVKLVNKMYEGRRADMSFSADPTEDRILKSRLKLIMRDEYPESYVWKLGGIADRKEQEYYARYDEFKGAKSEE